MFAFAVWLGAGGSTINQESASDLYLFRFGEELPWTTSGLLRLDDDLIEHHEAVSYRLDVQVLALSDIKIQNIELNSGLPQDDNHQESRQYMPDRFSVRTTSQDQGMRRNKPNGYSVTLQRDGKSEWLQGCWPRQ